MCSRTSTRSTSISALPKLFVRRRQRYRIAFCLAASDEMPRRSPKSLYVNHSSAMEITRWTPVLRAHVRWHTIVNRCLGLAVQRGETGRREQTSNSLWGCCQQYRDERNQRKENGKDESKGGCPSHRRNVGRHGRTTIVVGLFNRGRTGGEGGCPLRFWAVYRAFNGR
jgi:hypothetical protein